MGLVAPGEDGAFLIDGEARVMLADASVEVVLTAAPAQRTHPDFRCQDHDSGIGHQRQPH